MKRSRASVSVKVATAFALLVGMGACGESSTPSATGLDGGGEGGNPSPGEGGRNASTTTGCKTDSDCAGMVPPTTPADCATGKCDAVQGTCTFTSKDEDGDGHASANCKSTNGVAITAGDDCNDADPQLYPGHTTQCSIATDGSTIAWPTGVPAGTCQYGTLSCMPDGTESSCVGAVAPASRDCSSSNDLDCDGKPDDQECACELGPPAATQSCFDFAAPAKAGNGACTAGVQMCQPADGGVQTSWGACVGEIGPAGKDTCDVGNDNDCDGTPNSGCACINGNSQGCLTSANSCPGTQTCGAGQWGTCTSTGACNCTSGQKQSCATSNYGCPGTESCGSGNTWGACTATGTCQCAPGTTQPCSATNGCGGTQTCGSNYTWGACNQSASVCAEGAEQSCGSCGSQSCHCNAWQTCGGQGACSPGATAQCTWSYPYGCGPTQVSCDSSCGWGGCNPAPTSFVPQAGVDGVSASISNVFTSGPNCFGSTNSYGPMQVCPNGSSVVSASCAMVDQGGGVTGGSCSTSASGSSVSISVKANSNCLVNAQSTLVVQCIPSSCGAGTGP